LVANAVGLEYFVDEYFTIAYLVGFSFLKDAIDYTFCKVVGNHDFKFGAWDVGGLVGYSSVHFLSSMLKSHPLYFVKGEKLDAYLGNAAVDVIKARSADEGFDFFHFFKEGEVLLKTELEIS
jgi:hypothetical protein